MEDLDSGIKAVLGALNSLGVDAIWVFGSVVVLEILKRIFKGASKVEISEDFWKVAVIILGFLIGGFNVDYAQNIFSVIRDFVRAGFVYAASSSLVYQTIKLLLGRSGNAKTKKPLISMRK